MEVYHEEGKAEGLDRYQLWGFRAHCRQRVVPQLTDTDLKIAYPKRPLARAVAEFEQRSPTARVA